MNSSEFLRAILPAEGYYALVGIKNKQVTQVLLNDLSEIETLAESAVYHNTDFYFGCASFLTADSRKKINVQHVRAFWIDLDCGEGTAYETKQDGFTALRAFCKTAALPKPYVVDSGRGLHVYWPLTTPILAPLWQMYADKLVILAAKQSLIIKDPGCSTDVARILRVPSTCNFKNPDAPLLVSVVCAGVTTEWGALKAAIEASCGEVGLNGFHDKPVKAPRKKLDPVTAALAGNQISVFKKIAVRSAQDNGCRQIKYILENSEDLPEPLWRAVLSVAQVCEDRDKAIHILSKKDPRYDPQETEDKASKTGGPMSCIEFAKAGGAERCEGCKHKGKITGPIALGRDIARADPENSIMFVTAEGEHKQAPLAASALVLPDLPYPYFRGKTGGIYLPGAPVPEGTDENEPQLVYENSLDVVRRIRDPEKGEVLVVIHNRPKDGLEEIIIPLADAQSIERMKDKLGYHGVAAHKEQMNKIGTYMTRAVKNMQQSTAAEPARSQMGWTEDRQGVVWGRTMYTKTGSIYCPPASKSTTVANMMTNAGSFELWESIAERYAEPGFELYAACVLMAFGSMLNTYTYEDPVWVHMVSSESGTGKTTLTNVINSIWGDPFAMKLTVVDTVNALEKRRVVFNSMAICQDEITNLPPEKLSQIAYSQSQGREKLRLKSSSEEIVNTDRRNNTFFSNGNKHISDALGAFKTNAGGEYARLVEIPFAALKEKMTGADHFGKILKNYGHAGPRYAAWLIAHESELQGRVDKIRSQFEVEFSSVSSERNWVALTAGGFAAADIVQKELGMLKKFDIPRIYSAWNSHMHLVRKHVAQNIVEHDQLLGDFINENYSNIIIPDAHVAATIDKSPETASLYGRKNEREARNKLVIRWEKDSRMLFIAQNELRAYCIKRSHSFNDLLAFYHSSQQFTGVVSKRLGGGTGIVSSPTKVLAFHVVSGELSDALAEIG